MRENHRQDQAIQPHGNPKRKKHQKKKQPAAEPFARKRQAAANRMPFSRVLPSLETGELASAVEPRRARNGGQRSQSSGAQSYTPRQQASQRGSLRRTIRGFRYRHAERTLTNALHVAGDRPRAQQIRPGKYQRLD